MENRLIIDIAICTIAAWVIAVACRVIKQPLLMAYMLAGFAIGPNGFHLVTDPQSIEVIASIGLVLLLFIIGLEMDLHKMFSAGKAITVTAAVQVFGCIGLGWLFFMIPGFSGNRLEALYLAVAASMSSTIIIIKILYDKRELETLAGRITLGILVLQDVIVIMFLAVQPNLKDPAVGELAKAVGKVLLLVAVAYVSSRFLLPPIFRFVAAQSELVLVGALAWCFAMAGFARAMSLSGEMGALIAGVMLSTFPYTLDVVAKVTSIRDFFVTLFFVGLGMTIPLPSLGLLSGMFIFSVFLVVSRLITVFPVLYKMKLGHRVSLLPAINLCQMSELSLVLLTLGKNSHDVSDYSIGIAAFSFAFLAVDSTYAILNNDTILRKTSPWLTKIGLPDLGEVLQAPTKREKVRSIFILGFSWTASSLVAEITRSKPGMLADIQVVDFNPSVNEELQRRNVHAIYGDISRQDVLVHAGIEDAKVIICSLPDSILKGGNNLKLLRHLHELNPEAKIIMHAEKMASIKDLYAAGASYVIAPRLLESSELLSVIEAAQKKMIDQKRKAQAGFLEKRDEIIP